MSLRFDVTVVEKRFDVDVTHVNDNLCSVRVVSGNPWTGTEVQNAGDDDSAADVLDGELVVFNTEKAIEFTKACDEKGDDIRNNERISVWISFRYVNDISVVCHRFPPNQNFVNAIKLLLHKT